MPLLIIEESLSSKTRIDKTLVNLYKPDLMIEIKSQNYKQLLKNKNEIIKFLKFESNKRIDNEIY